NDLIAFTNTGTGPVTATVVGGAGNDTLAVAGIFAGSASGIEVFQLGTVGAGASITATGGDDAIIIPGVGTATGVATITAGEGNDTISVGSSATGTTVSLVVDGGNGNDIIYGKASGRDSLLGGAGNDTLFGGGFSVTANGSSTSPLGDTLIGGAGADVFIVGTTAKVGFIGLELSNDAAGSNFFGLPSYISGGTSAADNSNVGAKTVAYNGIEHVDVIVGFNPAEGDVILFNTAVGGGASLPSGAGTSAVAITVAGKGVAATAFQSGSIAYLGNNTSPGGYFRGADATKEGTVNTFGLLGANPTKTFKFDGKLNGTGVGELSGLLQGFTYDTNTGGLYFAAAANTPTLVAIFDGAPALTNESIQATGFGNTISGIPTTL
ncbi:MAG: hypothetical protein HC795_19085, partial [Coleofasciculaceae cyanobacterium RL_1_1]|nr:hypothetical protein [Coleofasciculaceae cyanobacterium RL_1_1]